MSQQLIRQGEKLTFIVTFMHKPVIKDLGFFLIEGRYTCIVPWPLCFACQSRTHWQLGEPLIRRG